MNKGIWVVGTSRQIFKRGSYTETKFSRKNAVTCKTPFSMVDPFSTSHSICLTLASDWTVLFGNFQCNLILSIKKTGLQFFEKGFLSSENLFKLKF